MPKFASTAILKILFLVGFSSFKNPCHNKWPQIRFSLTRKPMRIETQKLCFLHRFISASYIAFQILSEQFDVTTQDAKYNCGGHVCYICLTHMLLLVYSRNKTL